MPNTLKGWKFGMLIGGLVGAIGLALYPIAVKPMIDSSDYKQIQSMTRRGVKQDEIQPGNMKVWSDPFDRK